MILLFAILPYFLLDQITYVQSARRSLSKERCKEKSWILNECNWCKCRRGKYQCAARPCSAVDMFGHFKDAIADIDVGMQGHGVWRTTRTACTPGVSYRRNGLLCICDEDGNWPNKLCQDVYRVLHTVEKTSLEAVIKNEECRPNKLYLAECNVCFCSHRGYFDPNLCTDMKCQPDDPLLDGLSEEEDTELDREIYAACNINKEYLLGCRKCVCLRNNRLMCNNCTVNNKVKKSYCDDHKTGKIFNIDCNSCQCDANKNMYCTAKKCLQSGTKEIMEIISMKHIVKDDDVCGAKKYEKSCSSCTCIKNENGENILDCATKCDKRRTIHEDCVRDTFYELDCQVCYCYKRSKEKRQFCVRNPICRTDKVLKEKRSQDLQRMHGYCEPFQTYNKDCNVCECLADGKTLKCTSKNCDDAESITIDSMIPVRLNSAEDCPKGHSYKIDCNVCFCLLNGNSICTTLDCRRLNK